MMQKRMRLMITIKWSYLGTGEGPVFATRSMISSIMFCLLCLYTLMELEEWKHWFGALIDL